MLLPIMFTKNAANLEIKHAPPPPPAPVASADVRSKGGSVVLESLYIFAPNICGGLCLVLVLLCSVSLAL